ncbi:caspase family protein [Streptomyces sp. NPDC047072]|uniref:caspase family protein n=1 Tax=Streptomyces sp. NPDC047072 TaxID=3154809 RepID=UPI0033FC6185
MRLPDPQRSYAVLIGASTYRADTVADLPAVRNNLYDLAAVLTHPRLGGMPVERCVVVPDPTDVRAVYRTLRGCASAAEDTLLVYFAGHGQTGPRNELYLLLADTDPSELRVSALPFDVVREVIADSPAANRVVILDCCFSGRAIQDMGAGTDTLLGQVGIEGTYVLTSAPVNAVALAPVGATYTSFTGELLALLRDGVPGGPDLLTFGEIYRRLLHTATTKGLPVPGQRGTGTVDMLALTRNAAAAQPHPPVTAAPKPPPATAAQPPPPAATVKPHPPATAAKPSPPTTVKPPHPTPAAQRPSPTPAPPRTPAAPPTDPPPRAHAATPPRSPEAPAPLPKPARRPSTPRPTALEPPRPTRLPWALTLMVASLALSAATSAAIQVRSDRIGLTIACSVLAVAAVALERRFWPLLLVVAASLTLSGVGVFALLLPLVGVGWLVVHLRRRDR